MRPFAPAAAALAAGLSAAPAWCQEAALPTVSVEETRETDPLRMNAPSGSASRLGLSMRETPASVEVIPQAIIEQRGARTLEEALRGAAGLSGGGAPASPTTLSTRGFTNILYLYDGIRMSGAGVTNRVEDTWNYDRIEVLKGPASVLFGDSAIGGIVNFQTKRPDRSRTGIEALLAYGSYGSTRMAFGAGGAIGDASAYRIDYSRNDTRVGTIERNSQKLEHLTSGFSHDFGGGTSLDLSFDWSRDRGHSYWGTPLVPATFATAPTSVASTPDGRVIDGRVARNNYNVLDDQTEAESYWVRARITSRITPSWTLRNEFAANKVRRLWRNSESATFVAPASIARDQTLIAHDQHYLFDRLDATHQGRIGSLSNKFVIGAEIGRTDFDNVRRFSNGTAATAARLRVPVYYFSTGLFDTDPALTTGAGNRADQTADVKTVSVFGEDALKLTDRLTLVTGLRHDRVDVDRTIADLNLGRVDSFGTRYSATSGRIGAVFDLTRNSTLYAQFTNATIPVGSLFLLSSANATFPLSKGKQVEVGFKQVLKDVEWTAAAYKIELDNVLSRDANNPNLTVNNGKQSSKGIELSAAWRATPQLTLSGNLAVLDAQFDTLVEAGGVSRVGNTPPNVPRRVANAFASYRFAGMPLELYIGINHTSSMFTDNANTIRINGHTTADAALSYRVRNTLFSFRVRNLTDKLYGYYGGRAVSQILLAPRRTFELSAKVDF